MLSSATGRHCLAQNLPNEWESEEYRYCPTNSIREQRRYAGAMHGVTAAARIGDATDGLGSKAGWTRFSWIRNAPAGENSNRCFFSFTEYAYIDILQF